MDDIGDFFEARDNSVCAPKIQKGDGEMPSLMERVVGGTAKARPTATCRTPIIADPRNPGEPEIKKVEVVPPVSVPFLTRRKQFAPQGRTANRNRSLQAARRWQKGR